MNEEAYYRIIGYYVVAETVLAIYFYMLSLLETALHLHEFMIHIIVYKIIRVLQFEVQKVQKEFEHVFVIFFSLNKLSLFFPIV